MGDQEAGEEAEGGACSSGMAWVAPGFCIDTAEVTSQEYDEFWVSGDFVEQPPECSWNVDLQPEQSSICTTANTQDGPVVCVDWCDAFAYCKWVGKRLCGKIGGGSNGYEDYADAAKSQWFAACVDGLLVPGSPWEWEDSCDGQEPGGYCYIRRGGDCPFQNEAARTTPFSIEIGFRCCT